MGEIQQQTFPCVITK